MDGVFKALADPTRRRLLDALREHPGSTLRELCAGLAMARQSVSQHLDVLEAAGLVVTERRGREKWHHLNTAPIQAVHERWIGRFTRERVQALADLATALEATAVTDSFTYTTYVRTTAGRLWQALVDPAFTRRYWGVALESDWRPGSPVVWREGETVIAHPEQIVLEADPPRRLAYTWHTFTPEWAQGVGVAEEVRERLAAEPRSRVAFAIEPVGDGLVRLDVRHEGFPPDSTARTMCAEGWPRLLADLKTLLESAVPAA
jgi:DNA-binding transcriptional ArsR family regulator